MADDLPIGPIRVVSVIDRHRCAINKGSEDGIRVGQRMLVYGLGDRIIDPDSGEDLGELEIVRGRAKISHVQLRIATLATYEKEERKRKITNSTPYRSLLGRDSIEEFVDSEDVPFDGVQKGDYAKFI